MFFAICQENSRKLWGKGLGIANHQNKWNIFNFILGFWNHLNAPKIIATSIYLKQAVLYLLQCRTEIGISEYPEIEVSDMFSCAFSNPPSAQVLCSRVRPEFSVLPEGGIFCCLGSLRPQCWGSVCDREWWEMYLPAD